MQTPLPSPTFRIFHVNLNTFGEFFFWDFDVPRIFLKIKKKKFFKSDQIYMKDLESAE